MGKIKSTNFVVFLKRQWLNWAWRNTSFLTLCPLLLLGVESSSEDHSTSFVTEPGETNATFPPTVKKKKKRKKRKRSKVKETSSKNEEASVMSQLVAVRQQSRVSLFHKGQNLSLWDVSAQTLLNMTLTFLRHVPEVINLLIIQLFDQMKYLTNLQLLDCTCLFTNISCLFS